tara:strand:+ start:877 stop:1500 length:624 start_codon:yes stop_codon:yes gene_type:complete
MIKKVFGSVNNNTKTLYIANHKVANTTIINVLINYGYTDRGVVEVNISKLNYIFTFVRNPYERLLSRYSHLCRRIIQLDNGAKLTELPQDRNLLKFFSGNPIKLDQFKFNDFVKFTQKVYDDHWEPQFDKIERQVGAENVDFIGKFENFQEEFNIICDKIGIPQQELPHENKSQHKHYTEYYDDETREIVAEKYARDIECFGYKFGG